MTTIYEVSFTSNGVTKWKASFNNVNKAQEMFTKEFIKLSDNEAKVSTFGTTESKIVYENGDVLAMGVEPIVDEYWENIKKELGLI